MKIVYIVGGIYSTSGMNKILVQKINYLARHTDYDLYMVLTERPDLPWVFTVDAKVKWVNFNLGFDELDTMPIMKKIIHYREKQRQYKKLLTDYLMDIRPDILESAMRREISFINDIPDGSRKIGELHFAKNNYREFNKRYLPHFVNHMITKHWRGSLIKEIKRLDTFVVLTEEDKENWTELTNVIVIPNYLSYFTDERAKCEEKRAIAIGRYTHQKGFDMLIDIWAKVYDRHPDWRLDIYGVGDNGTYQNFADSKGLRDVVTCHPASSHICDEYMRSSIFALSSRYEGFAMVLMEAMSCGVPAVSFDCPCGPSTIITEGEDGFLIQPGDIDDFAGKLCCLMDDENLRKSMGSHARNNMTRFDEHTIMQKWIDLFENRTPN